MIKFDSTKMSVDHLKVKSVTTALGGSIRVLDENHLKVTGEEKYTKLKVPYAVARAFIKKHKRSNFINPITTAIIQYDNIVVALELYNAIIEDIPSTEWISQSEKNIRKVLYKLENTDSDSWYIDGMYVYQIPNNLNSIIKDAEKLSYDGKFRSYEVDAFSLKHLHMHGKYMSLARHLLMYVADNGEVALTPPIWKDLDKIAGRQLERSGGQGVNKYRFDNINELLSVNLNFALYSAKELSKIFGYEIIAPLQLPEMMVRLKTINLPKVPAEVKATFNIGMPFTHAVAWLIGLMRDAKNISDFIVMRAVLKYLTSKGIFYDHMFSFDHIYTENAKPENIVLKSKSQAIGSKLGHIPSAYMSSITGLMSETISEFDDED